MYAHIHELASQDAAGHLPQSWTHGLQTVIQASRRFRARAYDLHLGVLGLRVWGECRFRALGLELNAWLFF